MQVQPSPGQILSSTEIERENYMLERAGFSLGKVTEAMLGLPIVDEPELPRGSEIVGGFSVTMAGSNVPVIDPHIQTPDRPVLL